MGPSYTEAHGSISARQPTPSQTPPPRQRHESDGAGRAGFLEFYGHAQAATPSYPRTLSAQNPRHEHRNGYAVEHKPERSALAGSSSYSSSRRQEPAERHVGRRSPESPGTHYGLHNGSHVDLGFTATPRSATRQQQFQYTPSSRSFRDWQETSTPRRQTPRQLEPAASLQSPASRTRFAEVDLRKVSKADLHRSTGLHGRSTPIKPAASYSVASSDSTRDWDDCSHSNASDDSLPLGCEWSTFYEMQRMAARS